VTGREQLFFGDLCIKSISDHSITGSPYLGQSNVIELDLPAIFKIESYRNNILANVFNNETWSGKGHPTGGWTAVIFIPSGTPPNAPNPTIQTMVIRLDP